MVSIDHFRQELLAQMSRAAESVALPPNQGKQDVATSIVDQSRKN